MLLDHDNTWCRKNALTDVFLPDVAIKKFGSPELGQQSVRLIDMYYLECPGSTNPWEMGHNKTGEVAAARWFFCMAQCF